ncbi:MAG: hypothetical protein JNM63_16180 [Spirochaetia bacterium]|nr:hypothetical protein [Spirochaetia bacterium]
MKVKGVGLGRMTAALFFLALVFACQKKPEIVELEGALDASVASNRILYQNLSKLHTEEKDGINRRNLDAMNLHLTIYSLTNKNSKLGRSEVLLIIPSPSTEAYSGRSTIALTKDGSGGWWWNEKKRRLEVNPLE